LHVSLVLGSLFLGGCRATGPATTQPTVPRDSSAELVLHIGDQPFVTAEAAYRAVYALWKGQPFPGQFDQLAGTLRAEDLIAKDWKHSPDHFLDRGSIGFMVCRACRIRSGLNWMLTGLGRYAWRELQFKGIAGEGSEYGLMSGGEFVGLLLRAEDYLRRTGKTELPPVELGSPAR
jgi:hypothetical protein